MGIHRDETVGRRERWGLTAERKNVRNAANAPWILAGELRLVCQEVDDGQFLGRSLSNAACGAEEMAPAVSGEPTLNPTIHLPCDTESQGQFAGGQHDFLPNWRIFGPLVDLNVDRPSGKLDFAAAIDVGVGFRSHQNVAAHVLIDAGCKLG